LIGIGKVNRLFVLFKPRRTIYRAAQPLGSLFLVVLALTLVAAGMPEGDPRTIVEARALSTSLMADLIAGRIADATAKYTATKRDDGLISANTSAFQTILKLCGRPLDSKIENGGVPVVGEDILSDGISHKTFTFSYAATRTTRKSKAMCAGAVCRFRVTVEQEGRGMYFVSGLSCAP